jgi:Zn-dependent protease/predicted transcriptional regulator
MQDAWQIGRLFGIPLRVHVSWFIVFGLVSWSLAVGYFPALLPGLPTPSYWTNAVIAAAMLFGSVILHELGHSLVARRRGVEIAGITLFAFGGVSQMTEEPRDPKTEFQVAIIGPVISVVLASLFGVLAVVAHRALVVAPVVVLLSYLARINLVLAVFNLLPAFPLDGGRVLRAVLWRAQGSLHRATGTALAVGRVVAFAIIAFGVFQLLGGNAGGLWLALIGWFILQAGSAGRVQASLRQALGGLRVRDMMTRDVQAVTADSSVEDLIDQHFTRHTYGGYPVTRNRDAIGLVTLHDLKKAPAEQRAATRVETIMEPVTSALVIDPDTPVLDAFNRMLSSGSGRLLVLDRGRLVGLVTLNGIAHLAQVKASLQG